MSTVESKRPKLEGTIVTHNGTHHADEALAVHLLRKLPEFKSLPLIRTRDTSIIDQATIVVDVGATYDVERKRFDHHQRGFEEVFDKEHKTKLSSAGLIWKHYGPEILSAHLNIPTSDSRITLLWNKLYDDFVEAIDGIDNGIQQFPGATAQYKSRTDLSARVGYLNPRWNEKSDAADSDMRFEKASLLAGTEFFDRADYTFQAWLPAREIVLNAVQNRKVESGDESGRILLFNEFASWKDHLFTLEKELNEQGQILYVIYPDESGKWRIQAVPESPESFTSRKALPEQWRGVRDQQLSELSGIQGCIFVHASGFIGGNATKEGALQMAQKALQM
ncbi:unnamed protein product [Sympodiomycopsis kandeliae]